MAEEFPLYKDVLTKFPNVQTFQAYTPAQIRLRDPEAAKLNYFLETRNIIEKALPEIAPVPADNFRSLWYTSFGGQPIPIEKMTKEV